MLTRLSLLTLAPLAILATLAVGPGPAADKDDGWVKLFNGKDLTGWKVYLKDEKADPAKTFTVEGGVIKCTGKPNGYIITDKEYGDYVLRLEWRWPSKPGNSGVLLHVTGPDKIWPKSFEAQLFATRAGDIWLVDGFKLTVDPSRQDPKQARHFFRTMKEDIEKPVGEWNKYEITCKGDTAKLVVNGKEVNEATGAEATKGKILLQSEGAEVEFRNIELKPLK